MKNLVLTETQTSPMRASASRARQAVAGCGFLAALVLAPAGHAATITAASCSAQHVQTALNSAIAGDTVAIPAGKCAWSTQVSWKAPANVVLKGAGSTVIGGGDATVIVDNYASGNPLLSISASASGQFRLTGITFQGGTGSIKWNGVISISGPTNAARVDHIHVNMRTYSPQHNGPILRFYGVRGVVDHNLFDLHSIGNGIQIFGDGDGDQAFAAATGLGTADFLYVEDNVFNANSPQSAANDCSHGGKWVFRYNTLNGAALQTHPTYSNSGRARGCRAWEVYLNKFTGSTASPNYNAFWIDAGTGVAWGNSVSGYTTFATLHDSRRNNSRSSQTPPPNGWGYCGTSFNGVGSNWDGNSNTSTGYPCLDQPGRGKGDLLTGNFPNVINSATGCSASSACAWPRQALEPIYEWSNTWSCSGCSNGFWSVADPEVIAPNRDYYLYTTSFTGATGVGRGALSARPGTCTKDVAYWATDTNTLYRCSSTNTWTVYYTPFTYPHPLVSGSSDPKPLPAPTNLRVQ